VRSLPWIAALFAAGTLLYLVAVAGPAARALAEQHRLEEIAAENRAFCEQFGMPPGSAEHLQCAEALMEIRAKHDMRRAEEMQGIL